MNACTFAGTLGSDPESRATQTGKTVVSFRLAVRQWGKDDALWLTVKCWGKTGESVANNMRKGCKVTVAGRLSLDEWTGRDGDKRQTLELTANDVTFHTFPERGDSRPAQRPQQQPAASWGTPPAQPGNGFGTDPIPF